MNNTVNVGMRSEHLVQCLLICDVNLVEIRSLSAEKFDAIEGDFGGIVQAVDDDDLVTMFEEGERGKRPDITGASMQSSISNMSLAFWRIVGQAKSKPQALHNHVIEYGGVGFPRRFHTHPVIRTVPTAIIDMLGSEKGFVLRDTSATFKWIDLKCEWAVRKFKSAAFRVLAQFTTSSPEGHPTCVFHKKTSSHPQVTGEHI